MMSDLALLSQGFGESLKRTNPFVRAPLSCLGRGLGLDGGQW